MTGSRKRVLLPDRGVNFGLWSACLPLNRRLLMIERRPNAGIFGSRQQLLALVELGDGATQDNDHCRHIHAAAMAPRALRLRFTTPNSVLSKTVDVVRQFVASMTNAGVIG
jgi:hypothetical protein